MNQITDLSQIIIEVDGKPLAPEEARRLGEARIQQRLSAPAQCELVFFDSSGPPGDAPTISPGASLRIDVRNQEPELFTGEVTAVEYVYGSGGGRETRVRAYDLLHRLRKRQPVRAHVQVTLADLAREMAAAAGLSVESGGNHNAFC